MRFIQVRQFGPQMLEEENVIVSSFRAMLLAMRPQGFAGCFAAIRAELWHLSLARPW
jgi:hypothetical protein